MTGQIKPVQRGFTLLELMVAMAIFALLAAAGWKIFDALMRSRDLADRHANQLLAAQEAYMQLLRDTREMLARPSVTADASAPLPAFSIDLQQMAMTRPAAPDPRQDGQMRTQRIVYRLEQDRLIRERIEPADAAATGQGVPARLVMLSGVTHWEVLALDPDPQSVWPLPPTSTGGKTDPSAVLEQSGHLPQGLEVRFEHHGEPRMWRFALSRLDDKARQQASELVAKPEANPPANNGAPAS